jgi:hypothetical protein
MQMTRPFLAGFLAGEAHFFVRPNNAGQSWCCGFQLCQRDDNADLVWAARDLSGCGEIRWKPAWGTSEAQVMWLVQSLDGCAALARSVVRLHLLGKKAGDFAIWSRAVATWNDSRLGSSRWKDMERFGSALRAHRHPGFAVDYTWVDISGVYLGEFLAGFASAEGHFGASAGGHPRFVIKLRGDDSAVLALLATRFQAGRLVPAPPSKHGRAQTAWLVTRLDELRSLVAVFDRPPPLGRAGRIYRHWRRIVVAADRRASVLRPVAARIRSTRRYRPPGRVPTTGSRRATNQERYIAVLEAWARQTEPPYTATSYERWRRLADGRTPTRNTLASFFGSWRCALASAGLPTDGCRPSDTIGRSLASAAGRRAQTASRRQLAVLRAVARCWASLGRVPGAAEFFSWRLQEAPESPGQAAVYRLFPGGWPSVLDALSPQQGPPSPASGANPLEPVPQPLHVDAAAREELAAQPDVEAGSADQLGHEGVAGHEVAARQRE